MSYPINDEQILPIIRLIKSSHGKEREELLAAAVDVLMYLVYSKAKNYKTQAFYDDLLQEGKIGLLMAIDKFDETRGTKFFWFADWYLKLRFRLALRTYLFTPKEVYRAYSGQNDGTDFYFDEDPVEIKETKEILQKEIGSLDNRSREVLVLHYGLNGNRPLTYREIGAMKNVSRQRIEQIKVNAMKKLEKKKSVKELYFGGM